MSNHKPPLIVILGPTASGKTAAALQLAQEFNGFVISADSRQVYRGLDIGTAKIKAEQCRTLTVPTGRFAGHELHVCLVDGIYHFLIDVITPDREFTLADYQLEVFRILRSYDLPELQGKMPFLVGGTGLYITAVVDHLKIPHSEPDRELRAAIEKEIELNGLNFVYQRLLRLDPDAENVVDPANPRRVIRALEICLSTGKPFTKQQQKGPELFRTLQIGLAPTRDILYQRIDRRVDEMRAQGLEQEVRALAEKYNPRLPAFSGIGYRQLLQAFSGAISVDKAFSNIKRDSKRYVRRQMTWWRRDPRIGWLEAGEGARDPVQRFLQS